MSIPEALRVRVSSESRQGGGVTSAVSQIMPMDELAAMILAVTGKDPVQFAAMFSQGTVVSGPSHVRWDPFTLDPTEVRRLLGRFPDPDPERRFDPGLCTSVVLLGLVQPLTIDRDHGSKRRFLKQESFWDKE